MQAFGEEGVAKGHWSLSAVKSLGCGIHPVSRLAGSPKERGTVSRRLGGQSLAGGEWAEMSVVPCLAARGGSEHWD